MYEDLKKYIFPNGKYSNIRANAQSIRKHFPEIYEKIKDNYKTNLYLILHDMDEIPICENPKCNNKVSLKNIGEGFRKYCSRKCLSEHQKNDVNFSNKIRESHRIKNIKKLREKYGHNLEVYHYDKDKNYFKIENYCRHSPIIIYRSVFTKLIENNKNLCIECNRELIESYIPSNSEIRKFQNNFEEFYSRNSLNLKREWFELYEPYKYKIILQWSAHIKNIELNERIYLFKNKFKNVPKCPICKNRKLNFINLYEGYSKTCGNYSCLRNTSTKELEVYDYIKSLDNSTKLKFHLDNKEYDIIIPSKNILIEFNGLFWHGDLIQENKKYHYEKWKNAINNNYELLNIWEDDWEYKRNVVKSMIQNKLNLNNRIFARKCNIKEISNKEANGFLEKNHLQGKVFSKYNIGLFYNEELISLMTFGKRKISSKSYYEMLRFCNKIGYSVIGGASKLLNYFLKKYEPGKIISYANLDYSNGNLYKKLGFENKGHTGINYWWSKDKKKYHRSKFMKYKLVKEGYDKNKTEDEIMRERKYFKIWGCGNLKYELNLEK